MQQLLKQLGESSVVVQTTVTTPHPHPQVLQTLAGMKVVLTINRS